MTVMSECDEGIKKTKEDKDLHYFHQSLGTGRDQEGSEG